jgi:hypothetical protein
MYMPCHQSIHTQEKLMADTQSRDYQTKATKFKVPAILSNETNTPSNILS